MSVGKICSREVHLAEFRESVQTAAERMLERNVGTLVVLDGERRPVGMLTDRDLALRVLVPGHDPRRVTVGEVATRHPRTVGVDAPIEDALVTMSELGVRRLPVVGPEERLVGMISLDDVLALLCEEMGSLGSVLEHAVPGRTPPALRTRRVPAV